MEERGTQLGNKITTSTVVNMIFGGHSIYIARFIEKSPIAKHENTFEKAGGQQELAKNQTKV